MGRAPCCEKLGLKRGPWTPEEDQLLIAYIHKFGHGNWRALPKLAGLLRCGKSCRLRWTNYLRPDIKRGNFTKEEEDAIFQLHQSLGNRWSTIAAKLPGRTDNEIKNVWHTHLKKKLTQNQSTPDTEAHLINCEGNLKKESKSKSKSRSRTRAKAKPKSKSKTGPETKNRPIPEKLEIPCNAPLCPEPCSSEPSSGIESGMTSEYISKAENIKEDEHTESWGALPQTDEILWSDFLPVEQFNILEELTTIKTEPEAQFPVSSISTQSSINNDSVDFWYELFAQSQELLDIPDF